MSHRSRALGICSAALVGFVLGAQSHSSDSSPGEGKSSGDEPEELDDAATVLVQHKLKTVMAKKKDGSKGSELANAFGLTEEKKFKLLWGEGESSEDCLGDFGNWTTCGIDCYHSRQYHIVQPASGDGKACQHRDAFIDAQACTGGECPFYEDPFLTGEDAEVDMRNFMIDDFADDGDEACVAPNMPPSAERRGR